jgi:phosphohistidine phosphatase SixA
MTIRKTIVYLVRHAHAGQRAASGRDIYRPLSERGIAEAQGLIDGLMDSQIDAVLSSPATRCVQTVQGLAKSRGLEVVEVEDLWEDSLPNDMLAVIEACSDTENIAVCSHGNLIPEVLEMMARKHKIEVIGRGCEKGSVWELHRSDKTWERARYVGTFTS